MSIETNGKGDLGASILTTDVPVLRAQSIKKHFGAVEAIRDATLIAHAGEIVGLVGDNGAGKSVLVKCICGALHPDAGELYFKGERVSFSSVRDAHDQGIETVYQDLAQAPDLSVADNMYLGREPIGTGWRRLIRCLDEPKMRAQAVSALDQLGIVLPSLRTSVRSLSGGQRQVLAVARAFAWASSALLMDEPTAALGTRQVELVYDAVRAAAANDLAVVVVSHDLPSVLSIADSIAIMRQGVIVLQVPTSQVDLRTVIDVMLGARTDLS
jgi:simple sugar transport system ATP-binding protein